MKICVKLRHCMHNYEKRESKIKNFFRVLQKCKLFWSVRLFIDFNNAVIMGVFSCWHVACEDIEWAAYSQLGLHVTDKYNRQQVGTRHQTTEHVAHCPVCTQRVLLVLAHTLAKVRNFEHVVSKTQCEHTTVFAIHTSVAACSESKRPWKHP